MRVIFISAIVLLQIVFLSQAEARGGRGGGKSFSHHYSKSKSSGTSHHRGGRAGSSSSNTSSECPCSGTSDCVGPRGGTYCITSGGNKRYR